jgi:PAS domain S-box-containing protein
VTTWSSIELDDPRLREALDAMPHKVWMVALGGPAIYYNPAMREFAGAALALPDRPSREMALVHPDDLPRFIAARNAGLAALNDWAIEVRLKDAKGSSRWHRMNFSVLRANATPAAWLATATDIDDLQRALTAAQQSEEQLRLAAEAAQLGIYEFDLETQEHTWSPELKAIFGLTSDTAPPPQIVDWIHPQDQARFESVRKASLHPDSSGAFQDEHRIVRPDGAVRWVFVKGRISFVGEGSCRKPKRGLGLVLDVTERKLAEQALAQSETRYRTLIENANDIVVTLELDGRITSINPAAQAILGYAPDELIGRTLAEFVPVDQMPMQEVMLRRKLDGEASTQYDLEIQRKDRQRRILSVNSRLIFDGHGKPLAIHSIARDVTENRQAETRQKLLIVELQHRTKNLLAVIQSIATRTFNRSPGLETFVGRLHALAHAQDFVASGPQGGVSLRQLLAAELLAFGGRVLADGEDIVVGGSFAQTFALVVHELATNAVKHGSLSLPEGRVAIRWNTAQSNDPELHFSWVERGGPPVQAPRSSSFGTLLMSSLGQSRTVFAQHGFEYHFVVPLAEVVRGSAFEDTQFEPRP